MLHCHNWISTTWNRLWKWLAGRRLEKCQLMLCGGGPLEKTVACVKWKIGRCTQFISAARQIHLREKCWFCTSTFASHILSLAIYVTRGSVYIYMYHNLILPIHPILPSAPLERSSSLPVPVPMLLPPSYVFIMIIGASWDWWSCFISSRLCTVLNIWWWQQMFATWIHERDKNARGILKYLRTQIISNTLETWIYIQIITQ